MIEGAQVRDGWKAVFAGLVVDCACGGCVEFCSQSRIEIFGDEAASRPSFLFLVHLSSFSRLLGPFRLDLDVCRSSGSVENTRADDDQDNDRVLSRSPSESAWTGSSERYGSCHSQTWDGMGWIMDGIAWHGYHGQGSRI